MNKPEAVSATEKLSRTIEIVRWIQSGIDCGELKPGAKLSERLIAERFAVSKTPVREALIHLSALGLVDLRQRRGPMISVMSVEQVVAMFELMIELESMAAKLASTRMTAAERVALMQEHARSESLITDEAAYDTINMQMHRIIAAGARNEYLNDAIQAAHARLRLYRLYPFQQPGRMAQSFAEHENLFTLIVAGDAAASGQAMHEHLTTSGRIFADLVAEHGRELSGIDRRDETAARRSGARRAGLVQRLES